MQLLEVTTFNLTVFILAIIAIILFLIFYRREFFTTILLKKYNLKNTKLSFWYPIFSLLLFIIMPLAFIIFQKTGWLTIGVEDNGISMKYYYFITTLVLVSNLIVVYNTISFMADCNETLILVKADVSENRTKARRLSKRLVYIYVVTIALSIIIGTIFINNFILHKTFKVEYDWSIIFRANEYFTLIIFFLFYVIDRFLFYELKELCNCIEETTTDKNERRLLNLENLTRRSLVYVDFAGFMGVAIILVMSELFHFSETDAEHEQLKGLFVFGLSSGAIAMHVIFTQINYNFLKTKYESREKEIEGNDTSVAS